MAKKFLFRGKSFEELEKMRIEEFALLLKSSERRSLRRGMTRIEKKLLERIRNNKGQDKLIRTKARDMVILPEMVGAKVGIYTGQEFKPVTIEESMIGHRIGEFAMTRGRIKHSAPGLGATRSSKFVPLK
jgi:small subunit ribosomal protein S19